jgi:endonuclease YncB( thermonuclease family)
MQTVRVIDGVTLKVGNIIYRLYGVAAPEKYQLCDSAEVVK